MKKIIILFFILLMLVGCDNEEKQTVCTLSDEGISSELIITSKGDLLTKTNETITIDLAAIGITEDSDKDLMVEEMKKQYAGYNGISADVSWKDSNLTLVLAIDYSVTNDSDLVELGLLFEEDGEVQSISLAKSLEQMSSQGYTCK